MWLLTIALPVAYGLVALAALRPVAGHFAWHWVEAKRERYPYYDITRPDGEQWFGAYLLAACLVACWPLVCVVLLSGRMLPKLGAERIAEVERREKQIAEMERELGIGQQ